MLRRVVQYPDGVTGIALLLLRLTHAAIVLPALASLPLTPSELRAVTIFAVAGALALAAGFGTRIAATLILLELAIALFPVTGEGGLLLLAPLGGASALILLGPGACSIDAYVFGRRVIRVSPYSPDRGDDN
jgi:uncharacterized membrane protein YphA (DoxX/SURF4 family)